VWAVVLSRESGRVHTIGLRPANMLPELKLTGEVDGVHILTAESWRQCIV
jgi:hypothetical protein